MWATPLDRQMVQATEMVYIEVARQLERELAAALHALDTLDARITELEPDAERYRYARAHASLILTDDSMFLAGLHVEAYYDTPQILYITPPNNSFARTAELFDAAIDAAGEKEGK